MSALRSLVRPAATAACALVAAGCLRRTAGPAAGTPSARGTSTQEEALGPVEESDRPMASFTLDGAPFCFAGTNNYYLIYKSRPMVDDVLETTKSLGLKVIRIWGFLDRGSLDDGKTVRNVDGAGEKGGVYFQYWDPAQKRPAYNDGKDGLERLDYVLDKAQKLGLKVMLVLTNNWKDFGGMDQYLVWYGLHEHQLFYTDPTVNEAYRSWVAHLLSHENSLNGTTYRNDPTIFGWELANEPRCTNAGEFDHAGACNPPMLTQWVDRMSAYIKSIDPNHLVSVGDEGFFAKGGAAHYDGSDGVDHDALLAVRGIDFGTYHLYPESWGHRVSWASQWIEDHIQAARAAGKPTLLEEYGVIARRDHQGVIQDDSRRRSAYARWHELVEKRGGNGALFWMLAGKDDEADAVAGRYPDYDHFEMYATDAEMGPIELFAATMGTSAQACTSFRKLAPGGVPKSPFVGTARPNAPQAENAALRPPPT